MKGGAEVPGLEGLKRTCIFGRYIPLTIFIKPLTTGCLSSKTRGCEVFYTHLKMFSSKGVRGDERKAL